MGIKTENISNHASTTMLIFMHKTLKRGFSNHVLMQDLIKIGDIVFNGIYRNEQGSLQRGCRVWGGGVLRAVGQRSYTIEIAFSCYLCLQFCILHLHRFDFKRPKRTTLFPGYVYIKKQRGQVSAGFIRVIGFLIDPRGRPGFAGSTPRRVFTWTRTGPRPGSTRRSGPDFKTIVYIDSLHFFLFFFQILL